MRKLPPLYCIGCGKQIPNRRDRKTSLCIDCHQQFRRCPDCGAFTGLNGKHNCHSVEAQGDHACTVCGKLLKLTGYERWKKVCSACMHKRHRPKVRIERAALLAQFGGRCQACGYDRCQAALHLHHIDSSEKYDWSGSGKTSIREIHAYPERFRLLCANCHIELHEELRKEQTVAEG